MNDCIERCVSERECVCAKERRKKERDANPVVRITAEDERKQKTAQQETHQMFTLLEGSSKATIDRKHRQTATKKNDTERDRSDTVKEHRF